MQNKRNEMKAQRVTMRPSLSSCNSLRRVLVGEYPRWGSARRLYNRAQAQKIQYSAAAYYQFYKSLTKEWNMSKKTRSTSDPLFSISGAAKKLERDRRTIEKGIEGLKPDFVTGTIKKWKLSRIVAGIDANTFAPITPAKGKASKIGSGLAAQRARLARAQAEAVEHKNRIASGQFVPIIVVGEVVEVHNQIVRERMLAIPSCASEIAALINPTQEEIYEIIRREIYAGLEELADPEYFQKAGEKFHPLASYKEGDDPSEAT
jgi:hypothetical protein